MNAEITLPGCMRTLGLLWLISACGTNPPTDPAPVVHNLDPQWQQEMDRRIAALRDDIERDYAPKSAFNLSNSLRKSVKDLELDVERIAQAAGLQEDPQTLDTLLAPMRAGVQELNGRLTQVEADMNSTLDDVYRMREEVRTVLSTLDDYQRASALTLEIQRESLLRQLGVLDKVLPRGTAARGNADASGQNRD